ATDIARNCGLSRVRRIERGTAYYIDSSRPEIAALLHDRMTETVLKSFEEAARLFEHVAPRPLQLVPLAELAPANVRLGPPLGADAAEAGVLEGRAAQRFYPDEKEPYRRHAELTHTVVKCETHNHPTAISPFPGAATGAGGEIRDEGATGRGAKPKAGLAGY